MANSVPSDKLVDLQQNAQTTDEVVNSSALTTTARPTPTDPTGKVLKTFAGYNADINLALERIGVQYSDPITDWAALTEITAFEAHRYPATTGDLYIPTAPLPFTTGATFDSDNWTLLQGLTLPAIISDTSIPYIFDTVAEYKAFTIAFPVGKTIHLNDRDADFTVISGTGTGNDKNIIASGATSQSVVLKDTQYPAADRIVTRLNSRQWGAVGDGVTDDQPVFQAMVDYATDNFSIDSTFLQNYRAAEYDQSIGIEVYIPQPKVAYSFDSSLNIKGIIKIIGAGSYNTVIRKGASFSDPSNAIINISRDDEVDELWILGGEYEGFKINGVDDSVIGIRQVRHHFYVFKDIVISECLQGVKNLGGYTGKYDHCMFSANNVGFRTELYDPAGPIFEEPNNIDFISCISLENEQGWNLGGATNFNFIGGLTQGNQNEGLTLNGDTGAINFDGHYWEVNAQVGGYQIETPFAVRSLSITNGQISTTYPFLDAERALEVHIEGNNILGVAGSIVYISATSDIRHLEYKNNPRIFSASLTSFVIDNNKPNFVPDTLQWNDFATNAAGTYSTLNQIKAAFNGTKGKFKFIEDTDTPLSIDFPCTITSPSKDIGISRTRVNAVTVLSDDVDIENMKIATTGGFAAVIIGDGVSAYKGIRLKDSRFITGSRALGAVEVKALVEFCHQDNIDYQRLDSAGRGVTVDGDNCSVTRTVQRGVNAANVVFDANSTNCRWALIDGTVTDLGTGNSEM
jgi:hypothetical protein